MGPSKQGVLTGILLVTLFMAAGFSSGAHAQSFTESFIHLKPVNGDFVAFELDVFNEDKEYTASFLKTVEVTGLRLVIRTKSPYGLNRSELEAVTQKEYGAMTVLLAAEGREGLPHGSNVFSATLNCQAVAGDKGHKVSAPGLLCRTEYDEGDDGKFYIEPMFDTSGIATSFKVHFSVTSQRTSDHQGTPDGPSFTGALLNGYQYSLDQSVVHRRQTFANARPILRLKAGAKPQVLIFSTYKIPADF